MKNKKIGFIHIPKTGGTYLENILNVMGPEKLINFFGEPGAGKTQKENGIPVIETMKPGDDKHKKLLSNKNLPTCELFVGHFSHNIEKCFDEPVDFFTILREPIQRVASLTKQFLTSKTYSDMLMKGSDKIGDDVFWENVYNYIKNKKTDGLLIHEVHGFSNYMTKVIAGCDISDPNVIVDDEIFNRAIHNLKKMKYIGFFENYKKTIDDILTIFNLDLPYDLQPIKAHTIPPKVKELLIKLNNYDIKLYEAAIKMENDNKNNDITYVTALLDIGREKLEDNFKRDFELYLDKLKILLENLKNKNLVIYVEDEYFDFVKTHKPNNTVVRNITRSDIENNEYYDKIQKIRTNSEWYGQKSWLTNSPQAKLDLYNPLIFYKIHLLNDVSQSNPFDSKKFVWIDAGIANAQASPSIFKEKWFEDKINKELDKFLLIAFPYSNFDEIHGFKKEGLRKHINEDVNRVARATFFGGSSEYIRYILDKFRETAHETLDDGYMGTEESIFTILSYRHSSKINLRMINNSGLVKNYFDNLKNNNIIDGYQFDTSSSVINTNKDSFSPKPYKGVRNQQNPKTFDIFTNFFEKNNDIDLIVDIGAGFGGFTLFLYEQSKKINSKLISYEKNSNKCENIKNLNNDIDIRCKDVLDVFTFNEIENEINNSKKTLVLCDSDDNIGLVKRFSDILKKGDIIMAHDYAPNKVLFEQKYKNKIWNWFEISDESVKECVKKNNLEDFFPEMNEVAWFCKIKTTDKKISVTKDFSKIVTNLYVLTFNFPEQLLHTIDCMKKVPEWLSHPNLYLLDNSTNEEAREEYIKIAKENNFEYISMGENKGICGGRQFAAEHFDESDADYMFFFEDDMTINSPEEEGKFCRNGFRKYIPNLYNILHRIMLGNEFDFLKLSFTEVYFDNDKQCSWYNVPQHIRTRDWPDYDQLPINGLDPNVPLTEFKNIRNVGGVPYIDGEVYYANWPMIVSKEGNRKMFIDTKWTHPYEQTWMSHIYQKTKEGEIRPAVLLASPIYHNRIKHYKPEERREN